MKTHLLPSLKLTLMCLVVFVGIYSLLMWCIATVVGPNNGKVEFISRNGKMVGAENIGQSFSQDKYFWGRPSAVGYNAAGSAGSNKGPTNQDYLKVVQARIDTFMVHNPGVNKADIPSDLVCASGSGLDPHISPQGAKVQIERIAKTRNIEKSKVSSLVDKYTEDPLLGIFGIPRVNVLKLNLALDEIK